MFSLSRGFTLCLIFLVSGSSIRSLSAQDLRMNDIGPSLLQSAGTATHTGFLFDLEVCNIGLGALTWNPFSAAHPVFVQNLYRLEEGIFEQIGMGWAIHPDCVQAMSACGGCALSACTLLGSGCSTRAFAPDIASRLGPRSDVNPAIGSFPFPVTFDPLGPVQGWVRVNRDDIDPSLHPTAEYFAETLVVASNDTNPVNNAVYHEFFVDPAPTLVGGTVARGASALAAWRDRDPEVQIQSFDVPGDGTFSLASRALLLPSGDWVYRYALFCRDSHRGAVAFRVPTQAPVFDSMFRGPTSHSGEVYGVDPWAFSPSPPTWSTTPHASDPLANALRWGTTFTFEFTSSAPPVSGPCEIDLFLPGTPTSITIPARVPDSVGPQFVRGDANDDGLVDLSDAIEVLTRLFVVSDDPDCPTAHDVNADELRDVSDAIALLTFLFQSGSPILAPPFPSCGSDMSPLGCPQFDSCL